MNIDLCFVPVEKEETEAIPSQEAVFSNSTEQKVERKYAGQVFAEAEYSYVEAMDDFIEQSQTREKGANKKVVAPKRSEKALKREEEQALRDGRRAVRVQRKVEDAQWEQAKSQHKRVQKEGSPEERQMDKVLWQQIRLARQVLKNKRQAEDVCWRQKRTAFREKWEALSMVTKWIAILVVVDNCSRLCYHLPLFVAGLQTTSQMVLQALQHCLPDTLQYLISDRGTQFKARVLAEFFGGTQVKQVFTAPRRPQSNGTAERFVRTLKEWLQDKTWTSEHDLQTLLLHFKAEYNDRPHQGLDGFSPAHFVEQILQPLPD